MSAAMRSLVYVVHQGQTDGGALTIVSFGSWGKQSLKHKSGPLESNSTTYWSDRENSQRPLAFSLRKESNCLYCTRSPAKAKSQRSRNLENHS